MQTVAAAYGDVATQTIVNWTKRYGHDLREFEDWPPQILAKKMRAAGKAYAAHGRAKRTTQSIV
jgi:hypothetical protein